MTHFGIICPLSTGHFNTIIPLGFELIRRGHRVTVFNFIDAKDKVLESGLEFCPVAEQEVPAGKIPEQLKQMGQLNGLAGLRYTIDVLAQNAAVNLTQAPPLIKQAGVEALLVDQVSLYGGTIADFLNIPFITVCSAVVMNRDPNIPPFSTPWQYNPTWRGRLRNKFGYRLLTYLTKPVREVIADYRRQWNLPAHVEANDIYSNLAQISQEPIEFEFPRTDLPAHFHFTGPYHYTFSRPVVPFPFEKLTGQPLIYSSLGSILNNQSDIFQKIATACEGLDAQLVISLGGNASVESFPQLPGNPIIVSYAPQLELLKKASLTITPAGLNTTLESLTHGVPMVAIPIMNDQPGVASRIAWTGVGEVVPLKQLSVPKLRTAIQKVLGEESYKQRAFGLQEAIQRAGGVSRAADIIEQVVLTAKPVLALL
ncbi:glycosyltransferase [Laspinema olomoucense]|uniref:Glycosyltransferase n=1 Tax=Laspinema olomoucense D3b TaxID=2953688 RepID=A0ABT2NAS6_9CYAN|nr:glycosyltransferase [Laspinema sp. D3b]MCT7979803.1 glycosyltransferase [Laspinema sp. D3b]